MPWCSGATKMRQSWMGECPSTSLGDMSGAQHDASDEIGLRLRHVEAGAVRGNVRGHADLVPRLLQRPTEPGERGGIGLRRLANQHGSLPILKQAFCGRFAWIND